MSLFNTLSGVFKPTRSAKPIKKKSVKKFKPKPQIPAPQTQALITNAQAQSKEIIIEARDEALKIREVAQTKYRQIQNEIAAKQSSLDKKQIITSRKEAALAEKDRLLNHLEKTSEQKRQEIENLRQDLLNKLEKTASMTREEARKKIIEAVEKRSSKDIAKIIKQTEEKARQQADEKARDILINAMKHGATDYVAEYTISTVKLPDDDVKGRIIGKEGRNIRAFEKATQVDLDLDETPGEVRLSSFNPVRREIARQALKRLVADGRIQPARIEEYVKRARRDIEKTMFEEGKKLCHAVGVYNLPQDLIQILGRFKYRFSYGQNMVAHTLEETKMGIALAQEVGANTDTVRLGCLLHDVGKVIPDEEGSHVDIGVNVLKKYQIPQEIIDCVAQHHEDEEFTSSESVLVYIADAISGARPGARYEDYEEYVKRLTKLEDIAKDFKGIKEAFAIQAGREVRVIANPKELSDDQMVVLADKIKQKIEKEMTYPGTVTVNVIRESRASAVAK